MKRFITDRKYFIEGLSEFLIQQRIGVGKKPFAAEVDIPIRTLTEIENESAVTDIQWVKLKSALPDIVSLCPEGWGKAPATQRTLSWTFMRWEVHIEVETSQGDAYYQTAVSLKNSKPNPLVKGPFNSLFATKDSGVSLRDIWAYDSKGELAIDLPS